MARQYIQYVCQNCQATSPKWSGQCGACSKWNTLTEEAPRPSLPKGLDNIEGREINFHRLTTPGTPKKNKFVSGIPEFDRVCGGGLVRSATVLIGGDPGIGKSTMLLQVVGRLDNQKISCAYVSGEEATQQIQARALRLGFNKSGVALATATNIRDIVASLLQQPEIQVVVIDSIQTMYVDNIKSSPGSITQVRASAQELIRVAKETGKSLVLVGHVTKDGEIAGPRVLEHMVDTVLYFEGERGNQFRLLRAVKNRFGATDEIGLFEMTDAGLRQVDNPSAMFIGNRNDNVSGSAIFAGIEGTRPLLLEIQALVTPSSLGTPRRTVVGWDNNRLAMLIAVLDARCNLCIATYDIYLNVAGGLKINEPAADLAVAAALISSFMDIPMPNDTLLFGEISLSGEIRSVNQTDTRIKEADKLGFSCAIIPPTSNKTKSLNNVIEVKWLRDLVKNITTHKNGIS